MTCSPGEWRAEVGEAEDRKRDQRGWRVESEGAAGDHPDLGSSRHHQPSVIHEHVLDDRPAQPQEPRPYLMQRTSLPPPCDSSREEAGTLGATRRAPLIEPLQSPTETAGAPEIARVTSWRARGPALHSWSHGHPSLDGADSLGTRGKRWSLASALVVRPSNERTIQMSRQVIHWGASWARDPRAALQGSHLSAREPAQTRNER